MIELTFTLFERMNSFTQLSILVGSILLIWSLVHVGLVGFFSVIVVRNRLARSEKDTVTHRHLKASVLMSLRGCDPCLSRNLKSLLHQAYDDFEIIVVVDSRDDPAWDLTQQVKSAEDTADRLRIFELQNPSTTCSLKCSSLIQATQQISPDSDVVVLIDADVVPHTNWLHDALRPLSDPKIGVVTGNQWFSPHRPDRGSLLRSIWNSGAMVASALNSNPWAGTCAMRVADLKRSGLIEKWNSSVVDDGPIKVAFARIGLQVFFEPRLIMVNRDQCTAAFVGRYVTRMLTWSRIYEKTFANTVVHAVAMFALLVISLMTFLVALLLRDEFAALLVGASMFVSNLLMFVGFRSAEHAVSHAISPRRNENQLEPMTWLKATWVFLLLPICQLAHVFWTIKAVFARQASWRNITYRLDSQQRVKMVAYQPYKATPCTSSKSTRSI
ncbi:glycosyltransferase [Novipirellula artificiosorum]|uniref:N-glycosyltransferase n=1 Tax=Novipirellula artificiosorum TaxID=2528016 RepID=A0A5C6D9R5_9BACT|nr:glycosyltransferase [Novipirellula artificiosorum]TWU31976.1 N-glycosyltransferase [Novipirellula artificiosorum]